MSNNDLLQKVIATSNIGDGNSGPGEGFLSRDQADNFIDRIFDATVLWKEARKIRMNSPEMMLQHVRVGARIVRKAVEGTDTGENVGAQFTKVTLRTEKLRLDWEVTSESLEDNIEGESLDDHLARLFTNQFAQDLEELSIHGDDDSSDDLLSAMDGWHKKALAGGRVVDAATGTGNGQLARKHFYQALKAMPIYARGNKGDLRFYASTGLVQDYLFSQSDSGIVPNEVVAGMLRQSPVPTGDAGFTTNFPFGIELKEVPLFDTEMNRNNATTGANSNDSVSWLELTRPQNRIVGIQRDIQTFREFKPKKDAIEYTTYIRFGVAWGELDEVVTVRNIPVLD